MSHALIGKTITAAYLADDKQAIRFDVTEGNPIIARADGDCCSSTWIENVDGIEQLIGSPVVSVEDVPMPDLRSPDEYDVIAYYGCRITTGKGFATIDYRNSSNGYYGGSLEWPGDYFDGGVYKQNVSNEQWNRIEVSA